MVEYTLIISVGSTPCIATGARLTAMEELLCLSEGGGRYRDRIDHSGAIVRVFILTYVEHKPSRPILVSGRTPSYSANTTVSAVCKVIRLCGFFVHISWLFFFVDHSLEMITADL